MQSSGSTTLTDGTKLEVGEDGEILERITEELELDQVEALVLLRSFLQSNHGGMDLLLQSKPHHQSDGEKRQRIGGGKGKGKAKSKDKESIGLQDSFIEAFTTFYFEERLFLLKCLGSLLRISEDESHDYYSISIIILDRFATSTFGLECLEKFQDSVLSRTIPSSIRDDQRESIFWSTQILREQLGLLEVIFLLYYGRLPLNSTFVVKCLETLKKTDFGRNQINAGYFDSEALQLVQTIGHSLVLISVESLDLETAMDGLELPSPSRRNQDNNDHGNLQLVESTLDLETCLDFLEETNIDSLRSPILLAWSLILERIDSALAEKRGKSPNGSLPPHLNDLEDLVATDPSDRPIWQKLAEVTFKPSMELFQSLEALLKSPLISSKPSVANKAISIESSTAYRSVFKGLLLTITEIIQPSHLPNLEPLLNLWEITFGGSDASELTRHGLEGINGLCSQFWEFDAQSGTRGSLLETVRRRFPISFRSLLKLSKALTGSNNSLEDSYSAADFQPSDSKIRSITSMLEYLADMKTLAAVLPPSSNIAPSYELIEGEDYSSSIYPIYRATRKIPIFGPRICIQPGSTGQVMSEPGMMPVLILWEPKQPLSAWRLLRDVLASDAGLLKTTASRTNNQFEDADGSVMEEDSEAKFPTDINALALDNSSEELSDIIAESLDLFTAVLSGGPHLATALLEHLETPEAQDEDAMVQDQVEEIEAPLLSDIVLRILDRALSPNACKPKVARSAYRLLGRLLPLSPLQIWISLRSSNTVTGSSNNALSHSSKSNSKNQFSNAFNHFIPSVLLSSEIATYSFSGTLAHLDFIFCLFLELQRSQFAIDPDLLRLKTDVLLRGLGWIIESVWPEYQSWKFIHLKEKLLIGQYCTRILDGILSDVSLSSPASGAAGDLSRALETVLVTNATLLHLAPLVGTLGSGIELVDQLERTSRIREASLAGGLIQMSLRLSRKLITRGKELDFERRKILASQGQVSPPPKLGIFELLFFEHATVATRAFGTSGRISSRVELAGTVMSFILNPIDPSLNIGSEAANLITAICDSISNAASIALASGHSFSIPSLAGFLGTPTELENTLSGLIGIVNDAHQDVKLRIDVWTLLTAIVDSQPALATLLLTGRHLASDTESRLAEAQKQQQGGDKAGKQKELQHGKALYKTSIEVAAFSIELWSELWSNNPALLESILKFLGVAWAHAPEHVAAFESIRESKEFWNSLGEMSIKYAGDLPGQPNHFEDMDGIIKTEADDSARDHAHRTMCKARALKLLASDVQMSSLSSKVRIASSSNIKKGSLEAVLSIVSNTEKLSLALRHAVQVQCDPLLQAELEPRIAAMFDDIPLSAFRNPPRRGDLDGERVYGDDYLYDGTLLLTKLEGHRISGVDPDEEDAFDSALQQARLLVATANLDWSAIDSQGSYLRSWTNLFESSLGRLAAEASSKGKSKDVAKACLESWIQCAKISADERRDGELMLSLHSERMSLLTTLLEAAWGSLEEQSNVKGTKGSIEEVEKALEQARRLLDHDVFVVENSVRISTVPPYYRQIFRMVLLCTRRARQLLVWNASQKTSSISSEVHRSLHRSLDAFSTHAIDTMRSVVDQASSAARGSSREAALEAEDNLQLLASLLELLLRPDVGIVPHFWTARFHETALLPACVDLLSRAPLIEGLNGMSARPLYAVPLLSFFLSLASNPTSAEQLASSGLTTALSSNSITAELEENGPAPALLPSGQTNPFHVCWTLMLKVVVSLLNSLNGGFRSSRISSGASARFVESDINGFVLVYGQPISSALRFSPLTVGKRPFGSMTSQFPSDNFSNSSRSLISLPQLEEISTISKLFLGMTRSQSSDSATRGILSTFSQHSAQILQTLVYLLQHPRELASLIDEGNDRSKLSANDREEIQKLEEKVNEMLREITASLVAAIWEESKGPLVLCRDPVDWNIEKAVIKPVSDSN